MWRNARGESHVEKRTCHFKESMILIFSGNVARGYQYWEGKIYPIPVDADK